MAGNVLCTRKISRRCVLGGGEHIYVEQHGQGRIYLWYSSSTFKFEIHRLAISFLNHVTGNSQECTSGLRDNHLTPLKTYHRCQYGPLLLLYLLIAQSFAGFIKNKLPGKLFFSGHKTVPLYRTHVLCTQGHRNIANRSDSSWFFVGF